MNSLSIFLFFVQVTASEEMGEEWTEREAKTYDFMEL